MAQKGLFTGRSLDGEIRMHFVRRGERSVADDLYRHGNSRISAAIPNDDDFPYYFLIATGGGYVEGECYRQEVVLDDDTHAILTTQAPNYIYKCDQCFTTHQDCVLKVGENALCEYYFDETIPYKDALFHQNNEIVLEKHAKLILSEGLTAGYDEQGGLFTYHQMALKTRIYRQKRLLMNDFMLVDPRYDPMSEIGFFEGYTNFNSVTIIDEDINQKQVEYFRNILEDAQTSSRFGLSMIESEGMVLRVLGMSIDENKKVMETLIKAYRQAIGLASLALRKGPHSLHI